MPEGSKPKVRRIFLLVHDLWWRGFFLRRLEAFAEVIAISSFGEAEKVLKEAGYFDLIVMDGHCASDSEVLISTFELSRKARQKFGQCPIIGISESLEEKEAQLASGCTEHCQKKDVLGRMLFVLAHLAKNSGA